MRDVKPRRGRGRNSLWGALLGIGIVALFAGLAACDPGAGSSQAAGPRLSFQETTHDFGPLSASTPREYRWTLTNSGNQPLQITDVQPAPISAGACT